MSPVTTLFATPFGLAHRQGMHTLWHWEGANQPLAGNAQGRGVCLGVQRTSLGIIAGWGPLGLATRAYAGYVA